MRNRIIIVAVVVAAFGAGSLASGAMGGNAVCGVSCLQKQVAALKAENTSLRKVLRTERAAAQALKARYQSEVSLRQEEESKRQAAETTIATCQASAVGAVSTMTPQQIYFSPPYGLGVFSTAASVLRRSGGDWSVTFISGTGYSSWSFSRF